MNVMRIDYCGQVFAARGLFARAFFKFFRKWKTRNGSVAGRDRRLTSFFLSRSFICIFIFVCCLLSRGTLPLMVIAFDGARFASSWIISWNHFTLSTWSTRSFKIKSSFWRMLKKKNSYFTRLMHWFFKKFHIFNYFENFEIFFNCTKISQISKFDTFFFISNFYHFIRWFFFLNFWFHLKLFTKISQLTR